MADVTIRQVQKLYDRNRVLHGVDLEIADGEFAVIVGPSGCGKSTLLRMIAGLEDISAGEIRIAGERVNETPPRERGCAMVFQNYALYPHMTVAQNIAYPLRISRVAKAERDTRVRETAQLLGLGELLGRRPSQLSGGQRQRVAMGRAIIRQPQVFLFDEPLSNLDAKLRVQMRIEIRRMHRRLGATSIFVTHDQVEAMTLADKLIVMNAGNVEQIGSPAEIYSRPATAFVAGFMGAPPMNLIEGRVVNDRRVEIGEAVQIATDGRVGLAGEKVIVGIRPEDISLQRKGNLTVAVDMIEELGAGRLVYARLGEGEVSVAMPAEGEPARAGATLAVTFPAEKLHFFSAVSGQRIDVRAAHPGDEAGAKADLSFLRMNPARLPATPVPALRATGS
jgi:sn-glycerol 3-phosphate transport system ATP-binding protein